MAPRLEKAAQLRSKLHARAQRRSSKSVHAEEGSAKRRTVVRGVLLALALLVTVLPAVFVASPISYVPPLMIVVTVGLSFAYMLVLKRTLTFDEAGMATSCERGQKVEFVIDLNNASYFPHARLELYFYVSDLFGNYDALTPMKATLGAHEHRSFSFGAQFSHLGEYSAGISKVVVHDLLGLFSTELHNSERHYVSVLPRVFDIGNVDLSNVTTQESKNQFKPIASDDMDYAGVREYQLGDPMKTVHWNLSARTPGTLYTRLFEVFANPGLDIIVDPYAPPYESGSLMSVFDGLVESAVSADRYARDMGVESGLTYITREDEPASMHLSSAESSLELVQRMQKVVREDTPEVDSTQVLQLLRQASHSVHGHGNIALCTSRLDQQAVSTLVEAKMRRRNPLLFLSVPTGLSDEERKAFLAPLRRLDAAGVVYYVVEAKDFGTEVSAL